MRVAVCAGGRIAAAKSLVRLNVPPAGTTRSGVDLAADNRLSASPETGCESEYLQDLQRSLINRYFSKLDKMSKRYLLSSMSFNAEVVMKRSWNYKVGRCTAFIDCFRGALARRSAVELGSVVVAWWSAAGSRHMKSMRVITWTKSPDRRRRQNPAKSGGAKGDATRMSVPSTTSVSSGLSAPSCRAGHPVW